MATNFPTSLDALTNPTGSSSLTSPDHAGQHADINDAVEALEAKVGINSSAVTSSLDYKIVNIPATSITTGTLDNSRLPSAATTITSVGTLTGLTVSGDTSTASMISNYYEEKSTVSATAATGTVAVNAKTTGITYYTTNASANFVLNLRGDGSTTLSSLLAVGDVATVSFLNTNGTTAYYPTSIQVDGTTTGVTTKWQGGTAPTSGNASSIDSYVFMVVKTAATPTYTVFASQTKFA